MNRVNITILLLMLVLPVNFCDTVSAKQPDILDNKDLPNREGIKVGLGRLLLHSALKINEEYESNIFLSDTGEKADSITLVNPSIGFEMPLGDSKISADYDAAIFMYGTYNVENHFDQRARALAEINFTDYKIKVSDIAREFTDRSVDENSRRILRKINDLTASAGAKFDKLGFDFGYTNLAEVYGQPDDTFYQNITYRDRDRMTHIFDGIVSYRFWPKTSLFAEGDFGFIDYYNSSLPPGSYFIDALVGIKGKPTNKITADFKAGFRYQNYDTSSIVNDKDYIGPVCKGGFEFAVTKDDIVTMTLERSILESTYLNNNYYTMNMLGLKYTHKFNKKLSFNPYAFYQLHFYPAASNESGLIDKRYDNVFTGGCSLRYDVRKWASLETKYEFTSRDSRFSIYSFTDNRVLVNGTIGF